MIFIFRAYALSKYDAVKVLATFIQNPVNSLALHKPYT